MLRIKFNKRNYIARYQYRTAFIRSVFFTEQNGKEFVLFRYCTADTSE